MEGLLPAPDFLYGDGRAETSLRPSRPVQKDEREFQSGSRFFIHGRRVTRFTLREFLSAWCGQHHVKSAIDFLSAELSEEFYLPLSTAYEWLLLIRRWCRLEFLFLGIAPNELTCLFEMRRLATETLLKVFDPSFPRDPKPP